jgi:hypothetical protein
VANLDRLDAHARRPLVALEAPSVPREAGLPDRLREVLDDDPPFRILVVDSIDLEHVRDLSDADAGYDEVGADDVDVGV